MNVLKRIFHLLCDFRGFRWRTSRFVNFYCSWHPRPGFGFYFNIDFVPGHRCDPNDEDDSDWGAEFTVSGSLLWLDVGLTVPNDDHPDDEIAPPVKYCGCGREITFSFRSTCTGCQQLAKECSCLHVFDDV